MRYIILVLCVFSQYVVVSQTTIGLSLGGDYMNIEPGRILFNTQERVKFDNTDNNINSFIWGGVIEQHLSKKSYLSLSAFFSRKSITHTSRGFIQTIYDKIRFDHQIYSIDFNWSPFKNFYIGLGGTYSFFTSFERDSITSWSKQKSEYGALVSSSYRYKGLIFNLKYLYGLNVKEPKEDTLIF